MRKRILCTALLSLLALWVMAVPALATDYFALDTLTANPKSQKFKEYKAESDLPTITITANALYQSAATAGYVTTKAITWSVAATDSMGSGLTVKKGSDFSKDSLTSTATLTGKVKGSCTITVTAKLGTLTKTLDIKVTVPPKPDPKISAGSEAAKFIGQALSTLTLRDSSGTATSGDAVNEGKITFNNCPEYITITPDADTLKTYGVAVTADGKNGDALADATKTRTVTFTSTANNVKTLTAGETITITAYNNKADGSKGKEVKKTIKLIVEGIPPAKWDTEAGGASKDLGSKASSKKTITGKLTLVEGGVDIGNALTWKLKDVTTPVTFTATGLPDGLTLSTDSNTSAGNVKQTTAFGATLTGSPKPGYYENIYITAKNLYGSVKGGPYTLDVVNKPAITVDEIPAITWGQNYTYTVPAKGGENDKHKITYAVKSGSKLPGLKLTDTENGTLAGKYASADEETTDFKLESEAEKEFDTITLTVKNDFVDTAVDGKLKFKIKAVKPILVNSAAAAQNELNKATFKVKKEVAWSGGTARYPISVTGPGKFDFTCDNLPEGIEATDATKDTANPSRMIVTFKGTPVFTAKNHAATVTVSNGAGSQKIPLKFNITADKADFTVDPAVGDITPVKVDGNTPIQDFELNASFGPVTWKARNLPSGLKLSVDKSEPYDTKVYVVGTPRAATKPDKNGQCVYEITATNPTTGYTVTVSQDLKLFEKPKIQTKSLPNVMVGKPYNAKIIGSGGTSADLTWLVTIEEVEKGTSDEDAKKSLPATKRVIDSESTEDFKPEAEPEGTATLSVSSDKKTGLPLIVGSLDRIPASGRLKITATVTVAKDDANSEQESDPVKMIINVNGTPAKITAPSSVKFKKGDTASEFNVVATGTLPIYMKALVAEADVKKFLNIEDIDTAATQFGLKVYTETITKSSGTTTNKYLDLTNKDSNTLGIYLDYSEDDLDGKGKLKTTEGGTYNIANLPIRLQAGNAVTYNRSTYQVDIKSSDKVIKATVVGDAPVWLKGSDTASPDITIFETDGTAIADITYTASADRPYTITVSPKTTSSDKRNGLYAEVTQPTSSAAGKVVIKGTPTADKETKTTFTLTVTNTSSREKATAKVTVIGQKRPEISTKKVSGDYLADKVTEVGKSLSYKITAKGSKIAYSKASRDLEVSSTNKEFASNMVAYTPMTWEIASDSKNKSADLEAIGLEFDTALGMFKGTPTAATSKDNKYVPFEFTIKPVNTAGGPALSNATAKVRIGVKGKKPKLPSQSITLVRGKESYDVEDCQLRTNLTDDNSAYITWSWDVKADYSTWGFAKDITRNGNLGKLSGANLPKATRGVSLKVVANNLGSETAGNVKFVIRDQDPVITATPDTVTMTAEKDVPVTSDVTFALSEASKMMTGDTKIEWKISSKPSDSAVKASTPQVINNGAGCTVTLTAAKGISPDISGATFTVTAKNKSTGETASKEVKINVTKYTAALPAEKDAAPEDKAALPDSETEESLTEEEELAAGEGTVTYGRARTESGLTQAERRAIAEGGYVIAAILPEITVDVSGQYDLDVVSLDEAAAEGAELVWFAFPRNAESTEDDSIAEFYDEAGAEIYAVPESKRVVVSPWLEAEVTYAPVIAVKAPVAGDAKTSLDEAEAGDTVTEQAIENAAETPAEK